MVSYGSKGQGEGVRGWQAKGCPVSCCVPGYNKILYLSLEV